MAEKAHLPCPDREDCCSSDAYSHNFSSGVGYCHSCGVKTWVYNNKLYGKYDHQGKAFKISGDVAVDYAANSDNKAGGGMWPKKDDNDPWAYEYDSDEDEVVEYMDKDIKDMSKGEYVARRGITTKTMEFYGVKNYGGVEEHYVYPSGGIKVRKFPKEFVAKNGFKGDELFGMNLFPAGCAKILSVVEGECFTPDAEVFTPSGWVSLENYSGEPVLQVYQDKSAGFTIPTAVVDKHFKGNLVEYVSGSYYSLTTPEHNMVREHPKEGLKKFKADKNSYFGIPRTFSRRGTHSDISLLEAKLWVMLSADFTFRASGDIYGCVKKERKAKRAKELLDAYGVRYSMNTVSNGYFSIFIHRGHNLTFAQKDLPFCLSWHQDKEEILEEVIFWDGNYVKTRNQAEFSSNRKHNIDVVQMLAHSCGYVSTIIYRSNDHGEWMTASILFGKTHSTTQKGYNNVPYDGRVMCLTVKTGMLVVRQKGSISISGNCDAMSAYQMLSANNSYLNPVVSVPSATPSSRFWEKNNKYFDSFEKIILSLDTDEAGQKLVKKFAEIYPDKVYILNHGSFKDANEFLEAGQGKEYKNLWWNAKKYKPDFILSDVGDFLRVYEESPDLEFFETGIPELDQKLGGGISKGYITLIQAKTGVGKTQLVRMLEYSCWKNSKFKFATKHLEETHKESLLGLVSYDLNDRLIDKSEIEEKGKVEEVKQSITKLTEGGRIIFYDIDPSDSNDDIMKKFKYLVSAMEVDYILVEPLQDAVAGSSASEKEGRISDLVTRMGNLCGETGVGFVVIAHENSDGGAMYSSMITKKAGFKITLSANRESEDLTERNRTFIKVEEKNRSGRGFGNAGMVDFDYESYTLKPVVKTDPMVERSNTNKEDIPF